MLTIFISIFIGHSHKSNLFQASERWCTMQTDLYPDKDSALCCSFNLWRNTRISNLLEATCSRQYLSGLYSERRKKTLAGFRNSLCASDAVFAQSLLSKARNHNGCWPEAYIFIYRLFPMHLVLFGSCYFLPSSSPLAWFAGVVGKCREAGSEVMQVDQLDCSFPVSGVEKALSESSMSPSQD